MTTIVNPQTGEERELQDGQWVTTKQPTRPAAPEGFELQPPTTGEQIQRQLGLTARAGIEGILGLPALAAEVPRQLLNLIPGVDFPPQQQAISQALTGLGLPQPETPQERIVGGAAQALAGGAGVLGPAQALARGLPAVQPLTVAPEVQALTAIAGGAAAPSAGELGAGPLGQMGAGLAASLAAPSIAAKTQQIATGAGPRKAAEKMVERALRRDLIPESAPLEANRLGPEANLVDVSGPNVRGLAQSVTSVPGKAKTVAESVLKNRANRSVKRMTADLRKFAGTDKEAFQTTKSLIEERRSVSAPLYAQANKALVQVDDDLSTLMTRPAIKSAFNKGRVKAQDDPDWPAEIIIPKKLEPGKTVPLAALDYTKRALDDKIGAAIRTGKMDDARIFQSQKTELLRILDDRVPVYKEARDAFSDRSSMLSAMETGKKILRSEPDEMMEFLSDMSFSEKEMFTVGAMKAITDKLKTTVEGANAGRRIATDLIKERIRPAFPDDEVFNRFIDGLERENIFMQTKGILGGSPTQPRQASMGQLAGEAAEIAAAPASGVLNTIRQFISREKRIPEKVADEIGEILFSEAITNPSTFSSKIMNRIAKHGVSKNKLQALLDNINAGTIGVIATQEP